MKDRQITNHWRSWFWLSLVVLASVATHGFSGESCCAADKSSVDLMREKWGIEVSSLRMSGQGYFVDFRYKVVDPDKAKPLASKEWKPFLIDESSGKELRVPTTPKLGSLRQTAQQLVAGNVYFMFFGNSRGIIKQGAKVTVVVGDCRIENLTVQ